MYVDCTSKVLLLRGDSHERTSSGNFACIPRNNHLKLQLRTYGWETAFIIYLHCHTLITLAIKLEDEWCINSLVSNVKM